jgi:hypothetical protein
MATKKSSPPRAGKKPKRISGLEASLLSFRARYGAAPAQASRFESRISPEIRKIVFGPKKGKTGSKTLGEIRKVADANRRMSTVARGSRSASVSPSI